MFPCLLIHIQSDIYTFLQPLQRCPSACVVCTHTATVRARNCECTAVIRDMRHVIPLMRYEENHSPMIDQNCRKHNDSRANTNTAAEKCTAAAFESIAVAVPIPTVVATNLCEHTSHIPRHHCCCCARRNRVSAVTLYIQLHTSCNHIH